MHTRIHAYIHTCRHTCIHAYIHAYMHTCTHAHTHTCTHAHMHTCTHAYMHTPIHAYIHLKYIQVQKHICAAYKLIVRGRSVGGYLCAACPTTVFFRRPKIPSLLASSSLRSSPRPASRSRFAAFTWVWRCCKALLRCTGGPNPPQKR